MKKCISWLLLFVLMISLFPISAFAAGEEEEVVYFEDGSYMTISVQEFGSRASGSKSGTKVANYYGDDGSLAWRATLNGSFTYTGSSATCTSSSISVSISNSAWYTISKSASKSGASATGSVTMGKKLLGVTVSQISRNLTLTCDKNGNLS